MSRSDTRLASHLRGSDVVRLASTGIRARPTRALLSALGIAIGIAAMIAVIGISLSSRAQLANQLDALGTNMLTATAGSDLAGKQTKFSEDAVGRTLLIDGVEAASSTQKLPANVYRSSLSNKQATGGIEALAADERLLDVVAGELDKGTWLNKATGSYPTAVLGATAAARLGVVSPGSQIWLGDSLYTVIGILKPVVLAPELDSSALIGQDNAHSAFGQDMRPTTIYERSSDDAVAKVRELLGPTLNPQAPTAVEVSRPSDALAAKNAANQAFMTLLAGVGSIALLVGGIGVANTMIISVLERRREIGLRRALGAKRSHILIQFIAEALLLSFLGGALGCVIGVSVTGGMSLVNSWPFSLPAWVIGAGLGVTVVIGAIAGLYPAIRASKTSPTAALNAQ